MEIILQTLLNASTTAKRLHWTTKSFAQHIALQELYEALDTFTDRLAEEWMGKNGNAITINTEVNTFKVDDAVVFVQALFSQLESLKEILPHDEWIINTFEELQGTVSRVKYKLENLS